MNKRIGIYAGVFDPVHSGHISFALQALSEASLDEVYFLPERGPRYKPNAEHYGHRVAMLRRALQPYKRLQLAEVVERQLTVRRTFLQLQQKFVGNQIVFLMGADVFTNLPSWQSVDQFVEDAEFIVAVRSKEELQAVSVTVLLLKIPAKQIRMVDSLCPRVSSTKIRYAIRKNTYDEGLLTSVTNYAKREWLYATIRQTV